MSFFAGISKVHEKVNERIEAVAGGTIKEIKGTRYDIIARVGNPLTISSLGMFDRDRKYLRIRLLGTCAYCHCS